MNTQATGVHNAANPLCRNRMLVAPRMLLSCTIRSCSVPFGCRIPIRNQQPRPPGAGPAHLIVPDHLNSRFGSWGLASPFEVIGALRAVCIGLWTLPFARTTATQEHETPHRTSRPCAGLSSISSRKTTQRRHPSGQNASVAETRANKCERHAFSGQNLQRNPAKIGGGVHPSSHFQKLALIGWQGYMNLQT